MMDYPRSVSRFETSDQRLWTTRESAIYHEDNLAAAERATRLLKDGASVKRALVESLLCPASRVIDDSLDQVFASTKLSIPHWQCIDKPGYCPSAIRFDCCVFVGGDVGGWRGPYGNWICLGDLVRYADNTKRICEIAQGDT